jgi:succinoglycan biosynthesis transport protein ExoP
MRPKTTLLIETNKQKVVTIEDVYAGVGATREYFQTQVEIIKSREVSLKTIAKLKLYDHPDFDPRAPKKGLAAFKEQIGFATEEAPEEWNETTWQRLLMVPFAANLSIEPIRLSQLVVVKFTSARRSAGSQGGQRAGANLYRERSGRTLPDDAHRLGLAAGAAVGSEGQTQ